MTGRAARPIINLKHTQTLNTDRTCPVMQRPRPVQRPVTSVTSVRLHFFSGLSAQWKIVVSTPRKCLNPAELARREGERDPNPLYRLNSTAIANVLTPPSDLVMCECVSIFTIIFRGVISSIQMHMIMKCTPRGT
jgi:hypothetical protein